MLKDQFLIKLKQQYIDVIGRYNQDKNLEKKEWDFLNKAGKIELNISRGKLFDKACVSTILANVIIPERDYQSTIQWLGIQTFPANPLVPMFMGIFEHVSEIGEERCPGFFDVFPTIAFDEDKTYLKKEMAAVADKHDKVYQDLLEGYLKMFRVKDAGIGIGYGIGIAFGPEETCHEYFQDIASTIFKAYFQIVEKRKNEKPTSDQMNIMFEQRADWVRYTFLENRFFQGGVQLGVPPESFMIHMLPPAVKF